ncbi:DUF6303 family protein [Streptomyces cinereoruber]|uniref:DUF6303 family protein n=1 Tax=Streptomyces cinereoruber TaxID=67260 RepID=UPI00362A5458
MSTAFNAILSRRCCGYLDLLAKASVQRACWRLFIPTSGPVDEWLEFEWPTSRRHTVPTPDERVRALASLGYRLAPGAQWDWIEDETPAYHDHPQAISFLGSAGIVPLPDGE